MSWVVIVHTDPRSTVEMLERAGLRVESAGVFDCPGYDRFGPSQACRNDDPSDWRPAGPRTVLVVSAAAEVAA